MRANVPIFVFMLRCGHAKQAVLALLRDMNTVEHRQHFRMQAVSYRPGGIGEHLRECPAGAAVREFFAVEVGSGGFCQNNESAQFTFFLLGDARS